MKNKIYETYQILVPSHGESHLHLALLRTALHGCSIGKSAHAFLFPVSTEHSFSSYKVILGGKFRHQYFVPIAVIKLIIILCRLKFCRRLFQLFHQVSTTKSRVLVIFVGTYLANFFLYSAAIIELAGYFTEIKLT